MAETAQQRRDRTRRVRDDIQQRTADATYALLEWLLQRAWPSEQSQHA